MPRPEIVTDPFPSDRELQELCRAAWEKDVPATYENVLSRSLAHLGAYEAGRLVGFVNLAWDGGVHAFLLDTCVHPDCRRRGIATALVKEAVHVARARGAEWLHVDFEPDLLEFYRSCGFRRTEAGVIRLQQARGATET